MSETVWVAGFELRMDAVMLLVPATHPEKGNGYITTPLSRDLFQDEDFALGKYWRAKVGEALQIEQAETRD